MLAQSLTPSQSSLSRILWFIYHYQCWEGRLSPGVECPPGHCALGWFVPQPAKMSHLPLPNAHVSLSSYFNMTTNSMEYEAIYQFLWCGQYPGGCSKNEKRVLRGKAKDNYKTEKYSLFYRPPGGTSWKKVPSFPKERTHLFLRRELYY